MNFKKTYSLIGLLMVVLLVAGCGTVNIHQKLYRDGEFDLSIEIKSDSEMFLNAVKSGFEDSPAFEKAVLIELDDGYKYILEEVSFEEVSTERGDSAFESIGIKKEFKFPFYYYTITLKNKGSGDSELGSMGMSANYHLEPFGKIVDTNGVFIGEDKDIVKFNLMKTKDYYVTFRDFFLFSWLGGASKIVDREAKESKALTEAEGTTVPDSSDIFGTTFDEKEKTPPPKPTGKFYEQTNNGVTLTVTDYTFKKKSETYGKLENIELTIYNQGSETITPYLLIHIIDEKEEIFTIQKEIKLSEWLKEGEYLQKTIDVDLGVGAANNPKQVKIYVRNLWGTVITSVRFDTNLMEGFG